MASSRASRGAASSLDEETPRAALAAAPVNIVVGSDGNDVLLPRGGGRAGGRPGKGADRIEARGGDDTVDGSGGNDLIMGDHARDPEMPWRSVSGGNDRLRGGAGNDTIWGEGDGGPGYGLCGDDWIDGGRGDDRIYGDTGGVAYGLAGGNDRLFGGAGNDIVFGDCLDISRVGYGGDDRIWGGFGNDVLVGDAAYIGFQGSAGNDWLDGGTGDDLLVGDGLIDPAGGAAGNDDLFGGVGNDRLYGDSPLGADALRLGRDFEGWPPLEAFITYGGDDYLDGGPGDDLLVGGAGNDVLVGGSGRDTFLFFPTGRAEFFEEVDRILDFKSGGDRLDLSLWGLDGTSLDTDENGTIGEGDDAIFRDGDSLVIDLGSASGQADPERALILLEGVGELRLDDLVPLPAV
ncbi:MAG: hypothetical protein K6T74_12785 [Geminicoccaceae bacterium]|nr:hypothetical protein [Geminicoccaceae bacterium]